MVVSIQLIVRLIGIAGIFLMVFVSVDYYLAYNRASDLCKSLTVGAPVDQIRTLERVLAQRSDVFRIYPLARRSFMRDGKLVILTGTDVSHFGAVFSGIVLAKYSCDIVVAGDKVASSSVHVVKN
jgi:hypothetical protein